MATKRKDWFNFGDGKSYFHRVHRPLQCLVFIVPFLLFYQIGSILHPWQPENGTGTWHVVAFLLMLKFFLLFGAAGNFLPLLAVVAILISWHLARKDPWDFEPRLYAGMTIESVVWGIPFLVIGMAVLQHVPSPAQATVAAPSSEITWQTQMVLSVGAGIYEELLFRLIAIILLYILLVDAFELKQGTAIPLIIVSSALLFSAYHLLGDEPMNAGVFAFRTALGIYLAGIYIYRGFGIAVGAHAVYDLLVVGFNHGR